MANSPQDAYGKWAGYNITSVPSGQNYFSNQYLNAADTSIASNSVPISGVGVMATLVIPKQAYNDMDEQEIKKILVHDLAENIYKYGYVEFTRVPDHVSDDMVLRARIFVTPSDKVTMLRKINPDLFK